MGMHMWSFSLYDLLLLVLTLVAILLWISSHINGFFRRRGMQAARSAVPLMGHMTRVFLSQEHLLQTVYRHYCDNPNEKYLGFYAFNLPTIIIKDIDLIKKITVKDFDHFLDHKVFMDEDSDPLFGKNLFFLKGQKWRDMRVAMSPAYTGSKMKSMFPFVVECAEQITQYLDKQFQQNDQGPGDCLQVEMKDLFTRFTNDVIASTAFGVKVNSLEDKCNEFYLMGKKATDFSGVQFLKFMAYASFPGLMKFIGIPLFPRRVQNFFRDVVFSGLEERERQGSAARPDMMKLLLLARQGNLTNEDDQDFVPEGENSKDNGVKREWSHDDLTAQALAFLLAGFDTSSALLCFTAYELATNPQIQKRLQAEIDDVIHEKGDKITYMDLQKMKYIDMVVSESLRMWPPDSQLERVCTKSYELPPQNDLSSSTYQISKGDDIWIPIYSIHHDPKYHPDPFTFNPERFSDENKPFMQPFTFIPFGVGPRLCIGARFAVMEAKALMFHLLAQYDIVPTARTSIPLQLAANTFTMSSRDGFWLGLRPRAANN